ncbi:hypothetical protein SAMN05216198_2085 [Halopseudomonas litoralis]|uniref:IraD/Gp25-like domain-containing protein n=1 Tax=Halopseudomonas litoralis TaxID=797277 RepID=A0A1H1SP71_9GAMM|nr:GPW/gp25 family protein [Halopseudomonas litoralis]SDS49780.1 hypothetical protein SAMN05216198_2085 [Halopseudomonas litoralis]
MIGMDRITGKRLTGIDHLRQSVTDILTTPIGSRVMRRDYGSLLPELIDQPQNASTTVQLYAATCAALLRWEPRIRLSRVSIQSTAAGRSLIDLEGERTETNEPVSLQVAIQMGAAS